MLHLDALSATTALLDTEGSARPCVSPAAWFHVPIPKRQVLCSLNPESADSGKTEVLSQWLAESGGRHRLEFRFGGGGRHGGVWLGVAGVGRHLADAFTAFLWDPIQRPPHKLPKRSLGLAAIGPPHRLDGGEALLQSRGSLTQMAEPGAPLVLQVLLDLSRARPDLVREAAHVRNLAGARRKDTPLRFLSPDGGVITHPSARERAARVVDEAVGARAEVRVFSRRLPGELPLRVLARSLGNDLKGSVRWQQGPAPLDVGMETIRDLVRLLACRLYTPEG